MTYAGITKGTTAIATAMLLGAARFGCGEALIAELSQSQPEMLKRMRGSIPGMYDKAYRWVGEMEEISDFLGANPPSIRPPTVVPNTNTCPVLSPTMTSMRRLALAGVIADTVIMSTGAAVRLSASGLGCPAWPRCSTADVVASKNAGQTLLNTWIEFGNRLLNFTLVIITVMVFVAAWRFRPQGTRRRDLVWLAAIQPAGVFAQAAIGGIVVLTKLNPVTVSIHILVSASIVAAAGVLHVRCPEGKDPPTSWVRGGLLYTCEAAA